MRSLKGYDFSLSALLSGRMRICTVRWLPDAMSLGLLAAFLDRIESKMQVTGGGSLSFRLKSFRPDDTQIPCESSLWSKG